MIFLNFDNTRVEIDLDAIEQNFEAVREKAGVAVMAVIKADAYGTGPFRSESFCRISVLSLVSAPCWRLWSCGRQDCVPPF